MVSPLYCRMSPISIAIDIIRETNSQGSSGKMEWVCPGACPAGILVLHTPPIAFPSFQWAERCKCWFLQLFNQQRLSEKRVSVEAEIV